MEVQIVMPLESRHQIPNLPARLNVSSALGLGKL
jgi:hypothetical protein